MTRFNGRQGVVSDGGGALPANVAAIHPGERRWSSGLIVSLVDRPLFLLKVIEDLIVSHYPSPDLRTRRKAK